MGQENVVPPPPPPDLQYVREGQPETAPIPVDVRAEIHTYYEDLKVGSPRALALMDSLREIDLAGLIEGTQGMIKQEHERNPQGRYHTELNQFVAQMADRRERILDRIETVEGYAAEYVKANDLILKARESAAGDFEPSHVNVAGEVSEFFSEEIIMPMLGVATDVTGALYEHPRKPSTEESK